MENLPSLQEARQKSWLVYEPLAVKLLTMLVGFIMIYNVFLYLENIYIIIDAFKIMYRFPT